MKKSKKVVPVLSYMEAVNVMVATYEQFPFNHARRARARDEVNRAAVRNGLTETRNGENGFAALGFPLALLVVVGAILWGQASVGHPLMVAGGILAIIGATALATRRAR